MCVDLVAAWLTTQGKWNIFFFVLQHSSEVNDFDFFALGKNNGLQSQNWKHFGGIAM